MTMPKGCTAVGRSTQRSLGRLRSQARHSLACLANRTVVHQQLSEEPLELADNPLEQRQHLLAWLSLVLLVPVKALSSQATEPGLPQGRRLYGWKLVGWGD